MGNRPRLPGCPYMIMAGICLRRNCYRFSMPERKRFYSLPCLLMLATVWNKSGKTDEQDLILPTLWHLYHWFAVATGDNLTARFDWGIPLVNISSEKRTLQENGIYFSVVSTYSEVLVAGCEWNHKWPKNWFSGDKSNIPRHFDTLIIFFCCIEAVLFLTPACLRFL